MESKIVSYLNLIWQAIGEILYPPKFRIKILWEEIVDLSRELCDMRKKQPNYADNIIESIWEDTIEKKKKMINALLDYYFDPEDDKEYIQQNRP